MTYLEYFKLQSKNLLKDYKTKTSCFDSAIGDYLYQYKPKYFDIEEIIVAYDVDEENFSLMKAQHIIALISGFNKWSDILKASESELELAKLLLDNQDKVDVEDWEMYIAGMERDNNITFDPESRLEIFKQVFVSP
ncbi:TPA: hypothetical protein ACMWW0_001971 [Legionella pneumophila]|nr:hypothetical protein [Legionella pneumophila]HBD9260119.1 hypothetical protein [Legionella pneumophila]HCE5644422.1 hypothetical protein [Legionella pneumophila]HCE5647395.1 hypothetical protein [Legionella pneumophila]HCX3264731.1 hypothetical protein [Legionella pneumophila]